MKPDEKMGQLVEATVLGLDQMRARLDSLGSDFLGVVLDGGWTVAAMLAHVAFWDRWVEARWNHFSRAGSFHDLPDDVTDLMNEAGMAGWHALPAPESARLCLEAAISVTRRIERLAPREIGSAIDTGRFAMVDRTLHWYSHVDEIERAVLRHEHTTSDSRLEPTSRRA